MLHHVNVHHIKGTCTSQRTKRPWKFLSHHCLVSWVDDNYLIFLALVLKYLLILNIFFKGKLGFSTHLFDVIIKNLAN